MLFSIPTLSLKRSTFFHSRIYWALIGPFGLPMQPFFLKTSIIDFIANILLLIQFLLLLPLFFIKFHLLFPIHPNKMRPKNQAKPYLSINPKGTNSKVKSLFISDVSYTQLLPTFQFKISYLTADLHLICQLKIKEE